MVHRHVAADQLGPGLVAGDVGDQHVRVARAEDLGFRHDRKHEHGGRVAAQGQGDVVIVERMRRRPVVPSRLRSRALLATEVKGRRAVSRRQDVLEDLRAGFRAAGNHRADAVDEARAGDADRFVRYPVRRQIHDEPAK